MFKLPSVELWIFWGIANILQKKKKKKKKNDFFGGYAGNVCLSMNLFILSLKYLLLLLIVFVSFID